MHATAYLKWKDGETAKREEAPFWSILARGTSTTVEQTINNFFPLP